MNAMWVESGDHAGCRSESSIPDGPSSSIHCPVVTSIRASGVPAPLVPLLPPIPAIQRPFGDQARPPFDGNG